MRGKSNGRWMAGRFAVGEYSMGHTFIGMNAATVEPLKAIPSGAAECYAMLLELPSASEGNRRGAESFDGE
jgi:hypothetical protein